MTTEPNTSMNSDQRRVVPTDDIAPVSAPTQEDRTAEADAGNRFDPFCHTLDAEGRALCFADISGRRVHDRKLGTSGSSGPTHCQTCQKPLCPTCLEAERRVYGVPS